MATESITAQELKTKLDADETIHLVDLRSAEMYAHNHIPTAVNVPFGESFANDLQWLVKDKDVPLVGYFDGEPKYEEACKVAESLGYVKLLCLQDGIRGWMEQGYQLEFGAES
ncbi:MAG: rhodanese-like domain-containing protein [Candidatus Uhrbacteria bacterium]|nr:rhodanese-like domain-containing protein [Patescibacteria group bacterium]MBU1906866.1 rhodanese-like domain-containing protein [Patescibacteria group bacterium]